MTSIPDLSRLPEPLGLSSSERRSLVRRLRGVLALESEVSELSDDSLRSSLASVRSALTDEADVDFEALQVRTFALVREAARRVLSEFPYPAQVLGGLAISDGFLAEMATGEGKTLTATMPVAWLALFGEGVHVATANDYLARRDATTMGRLYSFLGLTVGVSAPGMGTEERRAAYAADITYSTAQQLGFDYLTDNLVDDLDLKVQRPPYAAVVDEADSLLIDEARTPLIISAPDTSSGVDWGYYARLAAALDPEHYDVDLSEEVATLTPLGVSVVEEALGVENLYDHPRHVHHVQVALQAQALFRRDTDYVVVPDASGALQVVIVDEHTGRMQADRRFQASLHEALEAKEGVAARVPTVTQASVTLQSYFGSYPVLGGMTGTASSDADELQRTYDTPVARIPTHRPLARVDQPDLLFSTRDAKLRHVVAEVAERHRRGQPVLLGTPSVEESEEVSDLLSAAGVPHAVLNARRHAEEATVVAQAGRRGAVTVATNMAGRGVDIKLGGTLEAALAGLEEDASEAERAQALARFEAERAEVLAAGGLYVLGTARYTSRRIDDQLRGRSGRQGEPGESRFYLSCEDDIVQAFGGDRVALLVERLAGDEDAPVSHRSLSGVVERAQRKVEQLHAQQRRSLLDYDKVFAAQRRAVYRWRDRILTLRFEELLTEWLTATYRSSLLAAGVGRPGSLEGDELLAVLRPAWPGEMPSMLVSDPAEADVEETTRAMTSGALRALTAKFEGIPPDLRDHTLRHVALQFVDAAWADQLAELELLQSAVHVGALVQKDPLEVFSLKAHALFKDMLVDARTRALSLLWQVDVSLKDTSTEESGEDAAPSGGDAEEPAPSGDDQGAALSGATALDAQ